MFVLQRGMVDPSSLPSITESTRRLSRLRPPQLPQTAIDTNAVKGIAANLGIRNVTSVRPIEGGSDTGSVGVTLHAADGRRLASIEVRAGEAPLLLLEVGKEAKHVEPKAGGKGWDRLDAAFFGDRSTTDAGGIAWIHQPFPPAVGEVPSLLLEALGRVAGRAGGMDKVLGEPMRLVRGTFADGALTASIAQPCVCKRAKGKRNEGTALGARLVLRPNRGGDLQLKVHCEHSGGCNTLLFSKSMDETPAMKAKLTKLHTAAKTYAACNELPTLASSEPAAIAAGGALLEALGSNLLREPRWPPRCFADKKRPRVATCELQECVSAAGFKRARDDLDGLQPTKAAEKRRKHWLSNYLDAIDASYAKKVDTDGLRWQRVPYGQRPDSEGNGTARQEATSVRTMKKCDGKSFASVCLQGMPRALRPYACSGVARDLDFKMCHPLIFAQLPATLTWTTPRGAPSVTEICKLCQDGGKGRDELFKELAIWHALDADADRWPEYRKDLLKKLVTQLFYGGSYKSWIQKSLLPPRESDDGTKLPPVRDPRHEARHPRVNALETEVRALREAIFTSEQWAAFVAMWRKLLHAEKGGDKDAIDRSVMSRIAQELEDRCLRAMVAQLGDDGWEVMALVYDGCIVRDRAGHKIDLKRLEDRVRKETGLNMILEEKELFDAKPTLTLARESD